MNDSILKNLMLGQATEYASLYSAELLQAVPRSLNREELGIAEQQPFSGCDIWHAYEVSWLNSKGKPVVALARCTVNASSPNIIESKSFKLYLNSFNQTRFASHADVINTLEKDLSNTANSNIKVELFTPDNIQAFATEALPGDCIDDIDISIEDDGFILEPSLLKLDNTGKLVEETLHSHLLKSNCLITNQPDWASVIISYSGKKINRESLLRYLISFRQHNEFHEQCVERIFTDIQKFCQTDTLSVQALYTRRGGLDINPYRTNKENNKAPLRRINRQ